MRHGILFFSSLVLLAGAAGGIFVLVHQGEGEQVIAEETLTASVSAGEKLEKPAENRPEAGKQAGPPPATTSSDVGGGGEPGKQVVTTQPKAPSPPSPLPSPSVSPATSTPPLPPPVPPVQPAESPQPQSPPPPPPPPPAEKININTANLEELDQITGVGPAIAQRIIDYRNMNGLFYQIEDLKNVDGVGEVNFEKMRNEITVGDMVAPSPTPPPPPPPAGGPAPSPSAPESGKININTASHEELQQITGVGEVIAQRIIDYRTQNGPFQTIEEIKNVKGIGDATFEKMKDEITI